jgi:hypothetical protein
MKQRHFCAGMFGVIAAAACAGVDRNKEREAQTPLSGQGCDTKMWLGVRQTSSAPCPNVPGDGSGEWFVQDPFASRAPTPLRAVELCAYIWVPGTDPLPSQTQLAALADLADSGGPLSRLEQSCVKTSGLGTVDENMVGLANAAFGQAVDQLSLLPQGPVQLATHHLALVDSVPDGPGLMETLLARHMHGRTLGLLIQELACPDPSTCPLTLSTHLAFGRGDEFPMRRAMERGAFSGRPVEAAVAIHRATDDWRYAGSTGRLVINLSLGWSDTASPIAPSASYATDTFAVYSAIAEASCYGALIIAAAGNTNDGPSPAVGPLYPAAWEQRPTLTNAECSSEYGITGSSRSESGPLLVSVGGVDGADVVVASARTGARPRLAAPAEHSGQSEILPSGTEYRGILSGSSVASAVGSAAAAVAWAYQPQQTATDIATMLFDGGEPLPGATADYCPAGITSCAVHRISICGTVHAACASGGPRCPPSVSCTRRPAFSDARVHLPPEMRKMFEGVLPAIPPPGSSETTFVPECNAEVTRPSSSSDIPCPNRQYANAIEGPYDHPQPGATPCRICAISEVSATEYKLFVSIDPNLDGGVSVSNGSIELVYPNDEIRYYNVALGTLDPGDEVYAEMQVEPGFVKGTISFLITGAGQSYSSKDPLVVY